jgi:hypothetical protein
MAYRVTASTMGSVTPGPAVLSGGYRYRGDPGWYPNHPRYRQSGQPSAPGGRAGENAARREQRMAVFTALRAEGVSIAEAGTRAGVSGRTARDYERRRRAGSGEATGNALHR